MGWKEKLKEWGGGDFTFLSSDGETMIFRVVGEPILIVGTFKKKPQERIAAPVITAEGFQLFVMGKRLARKLSKFESDFGHAIFIATRHGEEGDINSTYEVKVLDDEEERIKLFAVDFGDDLPVMIDEAVVAVSGLMQG